MKLNKEEVIIFGLSESKEMASNINEMLGLEQTNVVLKRFANGEMITFPDVSVRGKKVYVIQSTSAPASENIMELLIFLDSLKRSSAKEVDVIVPFYGYARQDRKAKGRQPITAKLIADMLSSSGIERLITVDLHSSQIQGFFDLPVDDLKTIFLIANKINSMNIEDLVVVSPDHGGINRARALSDMIGATLSILDKKRNKPNESKVMNVIGDDLEGKNAIFVDDMIDTGGTIANGIKIAKELGAKSVNVFCTHGIFTNGGLMKIAEQDIVDNIYMTNTIEKNIPDFISQTDKLKIIKVDELIAKTIYAQQTNASTSSIYEDVIKNKK